MFKKFFLTVLFSFFLSVFVSASSPENISRHVLMINSYHSGYKWTDDITAGVIKTFEPYANINLSIEYLDSKKQFDRKYRKLLSELFRYKMEKENFDLIIVSDDNALKFVLENNESIFNNLPVVFCGINEFEPSILKGKMNITGINENADYSSTLRLIHKLHPDARNVKFIVDSSSTGEKIIEGIGMAPGANLGDHIGVFEATHGTAPDIAGRGIVNPTASILSGKLMLEYMGWKEAATIIAGAITTTIEQRLVTRDLALQMSDATELSTQDFQNAVLKNI